MISPGGGAVHPRPPPALSASHRGGSGGGEPEYNPAGPALPIRRRPRPPPTGAALDAPTRSRIPVILGKALPAALLTIACISFWRSFLETGRWTSLLWMLSEGVVVALLVLRRDSPHVSRRPRDWVAGVAGSFLVLLVRPSGARLLPDAVGSALIVAGTAFQLWGKGALGRSFGIVAANRGVVAGGPYRIVRHPIYLGYLVTHLGFLASNGSAWNLAVYGATYAFQVARIFAEERILGEDERYREYRRAVRWRLLPGIF